MKKQSYTFSLFSGKPLLWLMILITGSMLILFLITLQNTLNLRRQEQRAMENAQQAWQLAHQVQMLRPASLTTGGSRQVAQLIEKALTSTSGGTFRSQTVRHLGKLGKTDMIQELLVVELQNLTQPEVARILYTLEEGTLPIWIENADLRTGTSLNRWNLMLEIKWLEHHPGG